MAKEAKFHADFANVTVVVNGRPLAMHAEVDITLRKPAKLGATSQRAWREISAFGGEAVSVELIPGTHAGD